MGLAMSGCAIGIWAFALTLNEPVKWWEPSQTPAAQAIDQSQAIETPFCLSLPCISFPSLNKYSSILWSDIPWT